MEFFKPVHDQIEAQEVTDEYLRSLPKQGANPSRFGEQVEIYSKNNRDKTYAQKGDFVVKYEDHEVCYFVIPGRIFRTLFAAVNPPAEVAVVEEKSLPQTESPATHGKSDDLASLGELSEEEKAKAEAHQKKLEEERIAKEEAEKKAAEEEEKARTGGGNKGKK